MALSQWCLMRLRRALWTRAWGSGDWHQVMWYLDPEGDRKSAEDALLAVSFGKVIFASGEWQAPNGLG